ncbi:hypothetical protein RJT34_32147 [Clitoria ternatea]|uniref:Dienelactone hydrolase domain-containing protein n=1 Tax=Clitoria ternatea TaxID=43366 RepID=A0AAN9EX58_CLITE
MLGADCSSNPPILNGSSGAGYVANFGGVSSYIIGSHLSLLAIVLVSDVYGYKTPNLRKIADKVAAAGYFVVVPDFFHGDPFDRNNTNRPMPVWIKDHQPDKGVETAKPIIEALKRQGVSAIGAAGFCWGGKTVVDLANSGEIQVAVLSHPTYVTVDDIERINIPIAILGGQNDTAFPPAKLHQFAQILNAKKPKVDSYAKVFPNVAHGWTLRYGPNDPKAVKAAEEAHKDMLNWFDKHLKH